MHPCKTKATRHGRQPDKQSATYQANSTVLLVFNRLADQNQRAPQALHTCTCKASYVRACKVMSPPACKLGRIRKSVLSEIEDRELKIESTNQSRFNIKKGVPTGSFQREGLKA